MLRWPYDQISGDERVVGRHLAVALDAHHLADVRVERLRASALAVAVAERHEQATTPVEHQPRAEVVATVDRDVLAEDHLHVVEAALAERAARHGGAVATLARLGV
jgi:hypothetical protein